MPEGKLKFRVVVEGEGIVPLSKMPVDKRAGEEGVDGKSSSRRRLKVNGVCTAGRYKNLEDGEPICAENVLKLG